MIEPASSGRTGGRGPLPPSMAVRVAVVGVVAFVLFGIIFFRLWYLQVLSGDQYLQQANTNRVRLERIQAPRGSIVDRKGEPLVRNRLAIVVKLRPDSLGEEERELVANWGQRVIARSKRPKGQRRDPVPVPPAPVALRARFARLGKVLGLSATTIQERVVRGLYLVPYAAVTIKTDVDADVRDYVEERADLFPGVEVDRVYLREYPQGELAAQLVGTVSEITPDQLEEKRYRDVPQGTVVGQNGLEAEYDEFLRGRDGAKRLFVNAQGEQQGTGKDKPPVPGRQVRLSLDIGLQKAGQEAYAKVAGPGQPGAFVAMDPGTGEVLAMGSFPTFDPSVLARPLTQEKYDEIFGDAAAAPQFNRAIGANYPTGSVFKPVVALAALRTGLTTPGRTIVDTGCAKFGTGPGAERCNANKAKFGPVQLRQALKVSSDIYFYTMGYEAEPRRMIQQTARALGFDRRTGIDLPGENAGVVPDPAWRAERNKLERQERRRTGRKFLFSDLRQWSVGDNVSLAIGQGDFQATPLQMAVAYAGIYNGGRVPTPHLGTEIEDDQGRELQKIAPPRARTTDVPQADRDAILEGLRAAAGEPGGTSYPVFSSWPREKIAIYGKTGTAQKGGQRADQSWYVAIGERITATGQRKPLVVAVTAERGGFGADTAAPIACRIFARYYGVRSSCAPTASAEGRVE